MTRLAFSDYLDHLRRESVRFREVLTDTDPATPVPSCPEWTAEDLLWHLGRVQHWWTNVVVERPASPEDGYVEPERPPSHDRLLAFFDEWSEKLTHALVDAGPEERCWTWSEDPDDQTTGFVFRRQAHEALIHRLDAELAAGTVTALDPLLAADGVEECLDVMYGGLPPWGRFDPLEQHVEFRMTDVDQSVWVQLGTFSGTTPDGEERRDEPDFHVVPAPGVQPATVVSGTAADLDAWLWHRRDDAGIEVTGDQEMYAHVQVVLGQPIT